MPPWRSRDWGGEIVKPLLCHFHVLESFINVWNSDIQLFCNEIWLDKAFRNKAFAGVLLQMQQIEQTASLEILVILVLIEKLDKVGPVDNRPSTD